MLPNEHETITNLGLGEIFNGNALDLICRANKQSDDKAYWDTEWKGQHFSQGDNKTRLQSIHEAINFRKKVVNIIANAEKEVNTLRNSKNLLIAKEKRLQLIENMYDYMLYCIGRGSHCVQDFYAHSNWVWLMKKEGTRAPAVLNEKNQKRVRLSLWSNNYVECMQYLTSKILKTDHKMMSTAKAKTYDKIMGTGMGPGGLDFLRPEKKPCTHAEMNLDTTRTWADLCFWAYHGESGYELAKVYAAADTTTFWGNIKARLGRITTIRLPDEKGSLATDKEMAELQKEFDTAIAQGGS